MKISYLITVCNELNEIQKLIPHLFQFKRKQDNVVIVFDSKNGNQEVATYLRSKSIEYPDLNWVGFEFNNDFDELKNFGNSLCTGDYIFQIDADEIPHENLLLYLPSILQNNNEADVFLIPRVNIVDGITQEHIKRWGWSVDKLEEHKKEKIFDLNNPKDLDEYNLLVSYGLIISEFDIKD